MCAVLQQPSLPCPAPAPPHLVYARVPSGSMLATATAPLKLKPTGKNRGAVAEVSSQSRPLLPAALLMKSPPPPPPVSASKASRRGAASEGSDLLLCSSSERLITRAPADLHAARCGAVGCSSSGSA